MQRDNTNVTSVLMECYVNVTEPETGIICAFLLITKSRD